MDLWLRGAARNVDCWHMGQAAQIFNSSLSAGRRILQSFGNTGCRSNHEVACQPWQKRYLDGSSTLPESYSVADVL